MGTIILELSFLLYKVVSLENIQNSITSTIEKYNINKYYLDFEIENQKRTQQKGVYTIHFEEIEYNKFNTKEILNFLKNIKKIPNVNLECIYKDNISCDIIYASKYYLKNMGKTCENNYKEKKKTRAYSETEFEILKGIQNIYKKNKNYFKNEAPKNYEEYLKLIG